MEQTAIARAGATGFWVIYALR